MKPALRVYFDNAASCEPDPKILGHYYAYASRFYANQEAAHQLAYELRQKIDLAAIQLSKALCDKKTGVHGGHSGTDIFSLFGEFKGFQGGNIVSTAMEHPALISALKRTGAEIREVKITNGRVDPEHLSELLDQNTVLTSIHHVQSETGVIQDLAAIRKIINNHAPQSIFMSDTIQSAGKIPIPWNEAELDIISVSGHKIGTPACAALLFNTANQKLNAFAEYLKLCRKEYYTASRPEPTAILTLAQGVDKKCKEQAENFDKINKINTFLRKELLKLKLFNDKKIILTIPAKQASPYILHFIVPGYQSGVLVRMLSQESVYFSAGSACLSETDKPGAALSAMSFSREDAYAGVRLSFCPQNNMRHAEIFLEKFQKALLDY
ncbi:MAG: aminotransferase class V-fold PLP-dependent enzyme [Victivallaceae bacterium]|nr:aminotransferase class V-fold PLP-dependent enzyme [Victivallaceae bacterium]